MMRSTDFDLTKEIDKVLQKEGERYTNDPHDSGGPTKWGITQFVARANGYFGLMEVLPYSVAYRILLTRYWEGPKFDKVGLMSMLIAAELFDSGVNMGTGRAATFLQQWLNGFNMRGAWWPDMTVDGAIGNITLHALRAYLSHRGAEGEAVMVAALNASQGEFYRSLAEARPKDEDYLYGWMRTRVLG